LKEIKMSRNAVPVGIKSAYGIYMGKPFDKRPPGKPSGWK
jgi:hypothetical protein